LGQGTDCKGAVPTVLFAMAGPYSRTGKMSIAKLAEVNTRSQLLDMNLNWDFSCNIVTVYPNVSDTEVAFKTNQVSDYDGQQRIQSDYKVEQPTCKTCWRKVAGLGAIDFGKSFSEFGQQHGVPQELNCGDRCPLYTLEEQLVDGVVVPPRALIGRSFRTGKLLFNITDTLQAQTMTWIPARQSYLGVGRCCTQSWCDPDCQQIPENDLVLFEYIPYTAEKKSLHFRQHIGPETGIDPQSTVRLGVEVDTMWKPTSAFVLYNANVVRFDLSSFAKTEIPVRPNLFIGLWAEARIFD